MKQTLPENEYRPFLTMAMVVPLAQAVSVSSWVSVLTVGLPSIFLAMFVKPEKSPPWLALMQWTGIVILTSEYLHWTWGCWPEEGTELLVPVILLILAVLACMKGEAAAGRAAGVLRYGTFFAIGAVLFSGAGELEINRLAPQWRMDSVSVIPLLLLPALGGESNNKNAAWAAGILLYTAAVSAVTTGVMQYKGDFYQLSRSLSIFGVAERFESITAAAMTLSFFSLLAFLLSRGGAAWECLGGTTHTLGTLLAGILALILYLTGLRLPQIILTEGILVLWVVLPFLTSLKRKRKKE